MKKYLIFLLFIHSISFAQTTYYVKNGGNDGLSGTSDGNAWATLSKVQTEMDAVNFVSGDTILFNRGDTFDGSLTVSISGLTIGAYGEGEKPIFSGLKSLDEFSQDGNIWTITDTDLPNDDTYNHSIFIDGTWYRLGRYPDAGLLYFDSYQGKDTIIDGDISFSNDYWNGGECVTRTMYYIYDRLTIGDFFSSGMFIFSEEATYDFGYQSSSCNGYIIQNHDNTLSQNGEWNYDGDDILTVYYSSDLNSHTVEYPIEETAITVSANNLIVKDIEILGYQYAGFDVGTVSGLVIDSVDGGYTNYFLYCKAYSDISISECNIHDIFSDGIGTEYATITLYNNNLENIGVVIGLDDGGFGYRGIRTTESEVICRRNMFKEVGYHVIDWYHNKATIDSNIIDGFCKLLNDGGAIYTYKTTVSGTVVDHNIIMNGYNPYDGGVWDPGIGIYQDYDCAYITYSNNILYGVDFPFTLSKSNEVDYINNKAFNVGDPDYSAWYWNIGFRIYSSPHENGEFTGNVIVGNENFNLGFYIYYPSGPVFTSYDMDNNYYIKPWSDGNDLLLTVIGSTTWWTLSEWQASNPFDNTWEDNSKATPITYSGGTYADSVVTCINPKPYDSTFSLNPAYTYIDIDGSPVSGDVVVSGFDGEVFFITGGGSGEPPVGDYSTMLIRQNEVNKYLRINGKNYGRITGHIGSGGGFTLSDSIVAYWKLDESSGNAIDSHGNADGTVVGPTYSATGKINTAYSFDGTDDYVYTAGGAGFLPTDSITISAWVYFNNIGSYQWVTSSAVSEYEVGISTLNSPRVEIKTTGGTTKINGSTTVSTGTWYHIVYTYNGTDHKLYLNGSLETNSYADGPYTGTITQTGSYFWLGTRGGSNVVDGTLDEVGIWSRALSASEVSELYNLGNGLAYPFE